MTRDTHVAQLKAHTIVQRDVSFSLQACVAMEESCSGCLSFGKLLTVGQGRLG